jgi:hypothetical protein
MEHATYASRLQYLDADDIDDSTIDFSRLEVRGHDNTKLGDIDGFIVDSSSGRLHHIVIDSGGWFTSRRFLLPVGHATVDRDAGAVRVDVSRDALRRYPEFDADRFRAFSDDDLRTFERRTVEACCPDDSTLATSDAWPYETRHFAQPAWWGASVYSPDRLRPVEAGAYRESRPRELHDRELVTARENAGDITRRPGEDSPHFEGRAQPGDVLGLETGGERTSIGETSEDENKRRREAEDALRESGGKRTRER